MIEVGIDQMNQINFQMKPDDNPTIDLSRIAQMKLKKLYQSYQVATSK